MSNNVEKDILASYSYDSLGPYLNLDKMRGDGVERVRFYCRDKVFSIVRYKGRYCTGYYDLETFDTFTCPDRKHLALDSKRNVCSDCDNKIGFNPAFYNDTANISAQQKKYNDRKHVVYLANFGKGVTKVGIASQERSMTRLREQGARVASRIAVFNDAYQARALESIVHKQFGLKELMTANKKRALLNEAYDLEGAKKEIGKIVRDISSCVSLNIADDLEFIDFTTDYIGANKLVLPLQDVTGVAPMAISGLCVGMIGDNLIMENDGDQFVLSVKKMISHVVHVEEGVMHQMIKHKQLGLF